MIKEIKFTDNALKQIESLLAKKDKGSFFRIAIKGGGCSGFQYEFTFEQSKNEDDLIFRNILIRYPASPFIRISVFPFFNYFFKISIFLLNFN